MWSFTISLKLNKVLFFSSFFSSLSNYLFRTDLLAGVDDTKNQEYIEKLINKQEPLLKVLRLLCLYSIVSNGLKPKILDNFKKEILQTYGYEYIFTLINLEKMGLLKKADGKGNFSAIRKVSSFSVFSSFSRK
jgi:hypothetical protein